MSTSFSKLTNIGKLTAGHRMRQRWPAHKCGCSLRGDNRR